MAISYMDTVKLQDIVDDMSSLIDEFDSEINGLFTRFSGVPNITKEWIGNQSVYYFETIGSDKDNYIAFSDDLKKIRNKIQSDINDMRKSIKINKSNELE